MRVHDSGSLIQGDHKPAIRLGALCSFIKGPALAVLFIFIFLCPLLPVPELRGAEPVGGNEAGILRATLDNGLRIVIVRNTLAPAATVIVNYQVGSNEEPKGFPGMSHALEHMMFRGSPGLTADQLANITAAMGGNFNAATQQTVTQYFFTVPSQDLDVALRTEAIRMRGVLSTNALWSLERGAIEQEVAQDLSIPEYVFYTRLLKAMFKGTPYEHDPLGSKESFDKTTGAMLRKFHSTWYAPNNAILVIVGNMDSGKTLKQVKSLFGSIPAKKLPPRPEVRLGPVQPETMELMTDKPYGLYIVAFRMPGYDSPDYAAAQVLSDVLTSRRGSLYSLVPEGKALDVEFENYTLPKSGLGYAAAAYAQGADVKALGAEVRKALSDVVREGVPQDMVEAAKKHRITDVELEKNSVEGLAMSWSQALAVEGRSSPEDEVEAIRKVSVEDVNKVARACLDLDRSITAVLSPQASGNPVPGKGFGGKESFTPKKIKPVPLPLWARESLNRLSIPKSTLQPVVTILPNGIKLIVQNQSVSNTVSVYGHVKCRSELQEPRGKDGVADVLDELFSFGTASLERVAFLKALDDIGANASAGEDFSLQVLTDQFDRGLQLLADNELRPALPEPAFTIIRQQTSAEVAGRLKSPDYLADRALLASLYPKDDPKLRQSTPGTLSSLNIQDVKEYYGSVFRPDMTTIVVIGNISPGKARDAVQKYFGQWKAPASPKPQTLLPPVPLSGPSSTVVPNTSRVQDKVTLAQTLGLTRLHPDYYALRLGNSVLGGAFFSTRLYRDLRENEGLVYYVSSDFEMNQTRGVYSAEYACDPKNAGRARAIVVRNLRDMQTKPVNAAELHQAKALMLRIIPLSESSVDTIALGFIRRTDLDLPLDEPTRAAERYVKLTAGQVRAAFAKWIRPKELTQVVEGPAPR
jgi:zinc protease